MDGRTFCLAGSADMTQYMESTRTKTNNNHNASRVRGEDNERARLVNKSGLCVFAWPVWFER